MAGGYESHLLCKLFGVLNFLFYLLILNWSYCLIGLEWIKLLCLQALSCKFEDFSVS